MPLHFVYLGLLAGLKPANNVLTKDLLNIWVWRCCVSRVTCTLLRRTGQPWRHKPPMVLSWNSWNCPFTKRSTRLDFPTADSPKRTSLNWQILLPAFGPLGRVAPPLPAMSRYPVGRLQVTYWKARQKKSKPQNDLNRRKRTGQRLQSHSNAGASQIEPEPGRILAATTFPAPADSAERRHSLVKPPLGGFITTCAGVACSIPTQA